MIQHEIPYVVIPEEFALASGPFLAQMYAEIGPIFRTHVFKREVIYLIGPEANRFVLVTHRHCFSHHQGWGDLRGATRLLGDGLVTMDGAEHDWHRKMMHPAFTLAYMERYVPALVRQLRAQLDTWGTGGEIDIHTEMRRMTFAILAEALAGLSSEAEVRQFQQLFTALLRLGRQGAADREHLIALKAGLYDLLQPKIQERRIHPTDDILGMLVSARDEQGEMLSDEQLIAHINFLVGLGHESTSSLCAWTIYLLASHPAYLQQVVDEQKRILAGDVFTLESLTQMHVLDRALKEAERLYPPIESGPRGVVADCEFASYHIPAGAFVCYSIAATHLLPSVFADPTTFDPDRFLPPREEHKKTPYALVGFGGGPRICIAGHLANVDIKAMITGILQRYHMEVVAGTEPRQVYRGIGAPEKGIRLRIQSREG